MLTIPRVKYVIPSLVTLGASLCGFTSVWLSTQATTDVEYYTAASLIALAVFLDGFDGRIARLLRAQTRFGAQLDSLSDSLTFGVAPAVLVYAWGLKSLGFWGLLTAFAFAAAVMVRLARFNVEAEEHGGASRYFTGLPSPMGGLALALLVGVNTGVLERGEPAEASRYSLVVLVLLIALLMVSTVPFRTFKDVRATWTTRAAMFAVLLAALAISIRVDFMVALSLGLFSYVGGHLTGGLVSASRGVRGRAARGGRLGARVARGRTEPFEDELDVLDDEA